MHKTYHTVYFIIFCTFYEVGLTAYKVAVNRDSKVPINTTHTIKSWKFGPEKFVVDLCYTFDELVKNK